VANVAKSISDAVVTPEWILASELNDQQIQLRIALRVAPKRTLRFWLWPDVEMYLLHTCDHPKADSLGECVPIIMLEHTPILRRTSHVRLDVNLYG